jgi:hypothetical protein
LTTVLIVIALAGRLFGVDPNGEPRLEASVDLSSPTGIPPRTDVGRRAAPDDGIVPGVAEFGPLRPVAAESSASAQPHDGARDEGVPVDLAPVVVSRPAEALPAEALPAEASPAEALPAVVALPVALPPTDPELADPEPDLVLPTARRAAEQPAARRSAPIADVHRAQRLLAALGYRPGRVDGVYGRQTDRAIRAFQQREGVKADGKVSKPLLRRLEARMIEAPSVRQRRESGTVEHVFDRAVSGIAIGLQRLTGRRFDSRSSAAAVRSYCRDNPQTWIFDEGAERFVYCGDMTTAMK